MDEKHLEFLKRLSAESAKRRRRIMPVRRNQLALRLGRLVIAYNNLEHSLSGLLTNEVVELIGGTEEDPIGYVSPFFIRAGGAGLKEIISASISFRQKLDFLVALLYNKFSDNEAQQTHIRSIANLMAAADEYRNRMVHSVWEESYGEYSRLKANIKGRKGLKVERHDADIKQLRTAIEAIETVDYLCRYCMISQKLADKCNIDYSKIDNIFNARPKIKPTPNLFIPPSFGGK